VALWDDVTAATVVDLSQPLFTGMPQSPNHPPFRLVPERRHGDITRPDGSSAANELVITGGHVGTHVDALAHVSHAGRLFGGVRAGDVQSQHGFSQLGIDTFPPFVGRAVVLDVAAVRDVPALPAGYEISPDDLAQAQARAGVPIKPGDAVLIGTGWSRHWSDPATFTGERGGTPGPGEAAARWLAQRRPRVVGAETIAFEHIPAGHGHRVLPVHRILLVEHGINIVESMRLHPLLDISAREVVLVLNPLLIVGATGAPVRPLALVS